LVKRKKFHFKATFTSPPAQPVKRGIFKRLGAGSKAGVRAVGRAYLRAGKAISEVTNKIAYYRNRINEARERARAGKLSKIEAETRILEAKIKLRELQARERELKRKVREQSLWFRLARGAEKATEKVLRRL